MVVPVKESINKNAWIFFEATDTRHVVWNHHTLYLHRHRDMVVELLGDNKNVRGPIPRQLATMIYFSLFEES
jgi:hypothetical protein